MKLNPAQHPDRHGNHFSSRPSFFKMIIISHPFAAPLMACLVLFLSAFSNVQSHSVQTVAAGFDTVAVDDDYVFEANPLYINHNDQNPYTVMEIVVPPFIGFVINNGSTVSYGGVFDVGPYIDAFAYRWCIPQQPNGELQCSNTAIVTLLVVPSDKSRNLGRSCYSVGQPVNVTNGNMWLEQVDFSLPGIGESIEIDRFYNSQLQDGGVFGYGWTTDYDQSLTVTGDLMIKLTMPDGKGIFFGRNNTSTHYRSFADDVRGRIDRESDGTYTLTFLDGRKHKFDATGRLLWQRDRNGNQTTLSYNSNGILTSITDAGGRSLTLTPNANGRIEQISDTSGTVASYEYDPTGDFLKTVTYPDGSKYKFEYTNVVVSGQTRTFLATVKDAVDNVLETHQYDTAGRATTSEKHGGAEKYTLAYTSSNTTVTDALGRVTKYFHESEQRKNLVTRIEGLCGCGGSGTEATDFEYDENTLNLEKITDALGNETTFTYDATRNPLTQTDRFGTQQFTYNSFGQLLTYRDRIDSQNQDPNVKTAVLTYNSTGDLTTYTDALGTVTTLAYPTTNNRGLPESITDARNNQTKFKWFAGSGLLDEIEDPYTKKTKFTWDARGRVKTITNALDHITTYNYFDDTQRKVEMIYPSADKITWKYDIRRTLESVTDERGKVTAYEFDPQYRLKKITDPLGHAKEFGYDLMSNLTTYTDPLGKVTDYRYDDFNRLKEIEYPPATSGATRLKEKFEYDKLGRLKKYFDTADRLTEYTYNDTTRTNTVTNAELEVTTVKYNQRFQVFEVKDAIDQVYTFSYDPLGRMLSQTRAGSTMSFVYDAVGNLEKRTDYIGRETKYTHDNLNRLTEIEYLPMTVVGVTPKPSSMPNQKSTYGYDDISRLTSAINSAGTVLLNYDNRNRLKNTTDVFGHLVEYEYERTSTVNQRRLKFDGAMYAVYNFDDAERLATIVNSADSSTVTYGYDNEDKVLSRAYPNGVTTTYQYFDNDLLKRITDANSSGALFDRQYSYNSARQISQIIEPTRTRTFGYDNVDRLTSVTDATYGNESYAFDDVGNRTISHRSTTYTYSPFNKLISTDTATYGFDANGNTTTKSEGTNLWRYTWDYENRISEAATRKDRVRYKFDALGRRVQRIVGSGKENTKFIHDGPDVLVDDNAGTLTKYLNGEGIDNKLRVQTGSSVNYFLGDHLGSTNGLADASGAITSQTAYDSFGNQTGSLTTRYDFTGRERDDFSSLMYYRARFYDPKLGRFMSEDPIGFEGADINLYGYVRNSPLSRVDPFGLDEISKIERLQRSVDPETRPYVRAWNDCMSRCLATHIALQAAGFAGFTFGQPISPKRFVTHGSSPATSPISEWLSRAFPQKLRARIWAPTSKHPFATSNSVGRIAGRWVPVVSAGLMIADFGLVISCTNSCYETECRKGAGL